LSSFSWRYQDATGKVIVEYWVYIATQKKWVKLKYFSSDSALIPSTEVNLFRTGMNQGWRNGNNLSFIFQKQILQSKEINRYLQLMVLNLL
jgi:hypothetical protein